MIYLAAPYSHVDEDTRRWRVVMASAVAARLMEAGHVVFSPITHGHLISRYMPPKDHAFWMAQCKLFLAHASAMYILTIPGWDQSTGVAVEKERAHH